MPNFLKTAAATITCSALSLVIIASYSDAQAQFESFERSLDSIGRNVGKSLRRGKNAPEGVIAGGVIGGILGTRIFKNKIVGVVVGAAVGSFIGNEIAKGLNKRQKREVSTSTVSTIVTGEDSSWQDKKSGSRGTVRVLDTKEQLEPVSLQVDKAKVSEVPPLEFIGEAYELTKNANVRGGPSTDYKKVSYLKSGARVNVVGKVEGEPWYFISQNGIGSGFIFADLVKPSSASILGDTPKPKPGQEVYEAQVAEAKLCRTIEQSITLKDGTTKTQTVQACKGANGWEMQKAVT